MGLGKKIIYIPVEINYHKGGIDWYGAEFRTRWNIGGFVLVN